MFRRKPVPDLIRDGRRFADKNVRQCEGEKRMQVGPQKSLKVALTAMCCALALGGTAAESAAATRDWNANPAIIQLDTTEDVFAIGDAHGDPQRLAGALAGA